jgi:hypothetical protein
MSAGRIVSMLFQALFNNKELYYSNGTKDLRDVLRECACDFEALEIKILLQFLVRVLVNRGKKLVVLGRLACKGITDSLVPNLNPSFSPGLILLLFPVSLGQRVQGGLL